MAHGVNQNGYEYTVYPGQHQNKLVDGFFNEHLEKVDAKPTSWVWVKSALLATSLAGSALNQDGRSSNLTSPNGPSQPLGVIGVFPRQVPGVRWSSGPVTSSDAILN